MSTEQHARHHRAAPWPVPEAACQEIWKHIEAFLEAHRRLCRHAAEQIEEADWFGASAPDAEEVVSDALEDALKHETRFWKPDENIKPYWRSKYPSWPPLLHSLYHYLHRRIYRQVTNRSLRQCNTETGPPFAAFCEDSDPEAPELWDAESAQLHQSGGGNHMCVRPDEALFLKDNWETFQKFVHERSFADKQLIIAIADKIRSENLWQPALLADALQRPIQQINKAKTRLQSVLADMRTDAFIETLPEVGQRLVKFLRERVTSGRSLPTAIAEYAQVSGVSEDAVSVALNDIAQRKCDWSRRTHHRQIPLEVLGS
jgi:hypothetical protein